MKYYIIKTIRNDNDIEREVLVAYATLTEAIRMCNELNRIIEKVGVSFSVAMEVEV